MYRPDRNEQNPANYIGRHPQTTPTREHAGEEYIAFLAKCGVTQVRPDTQRDRQLQKVTQAVQTGQWRSDISDFTRFKTNIRASTADGRNWKEHIPTFLRTFRATPHSVTGVSPLEAKTGRKMTVTVGLPTAPKRLSPVCKHPCSKQHQLHQRKDGRIS